MCEEQVGSAARVALLQMVLEKPLAWDIQRGKSIVLFWHDFQAWIERDMMKPARVGNNRIGGGGEAKNT